MRDLKLVEIHGALALCYSDKSFRLVERAYDKNSEYFDNLFTTLSCPDDLLSRLPVRVGIRFRKSISFLVDCEDRDIQSLVVKALRKGYQPADVFLNQETKTSIKVTSFISWLTSGAYRNMYSRSDFYVVLALTYLAHTRGKTITFADYSINTIDFVTSSATKEKLESLISSVRWKSNINKEELTDFFYADSSPDLSFSSLFKDLLFNDELDLAERFNLPRRKIGLFDQHFMLETLKGDNKSDVTPASLLSNRPISTVFYLFSTMATVFGFDENFLLDEYSIDKDTVSFISQYLMLFRNQRIFSDRESKLLFAGLIMLNAASQEYSDLRTRYFDLTSEHQDLKKRITCAHSHDSSSDHSEVQDELESLRQEVAMLKEENNRLTTSLDVANQDLDSANKTICRLESKLEQTTKDLRDLPALREFYYSIVMADSTSENASEPMEVCALDTLRQIKGVFIGGHQSQHVKLRKILPNFTFLSTDDLSRDLNPVASSEVVFYYSWYSNHNMFDKVQSLVTNGSIPLIFVPRATNMNRLLVEMYDKYTEHFEAKVTS